GAPSAIIGVLSPSVKPYPKADIWIPLQANADSTNQAATLNVFAHLPRGMMLSQATARMQVLNKRYAETRSALFGANNLQVTEMKEQFTRSVRPALMIVFGAV